MATASAVAIPVADAPAFYDARAEEFATRYGSISFENVHGRLLPHLPVAAARILDVGAGSGRDAIALARMGYDVSAVEPSDGLRALAIADDASGRVDWIDDRLPSLAHVRSRRLHYDLIICSAVLIHVPPASLPRALLSMAGLLTEDGRLAVTVRDPVEGEPPQLFHRHTPLLMARAALKAGLEEIDGWKAADALGRGRTWDGYVFRRS